MERDSEDSVANAERVRENVDEVELKSSVLDDYAGLDGTH